MNINKFFSKLILGLALLSTFAFSEVAVIANKSVTVASIDNETLKNIYILDSKSLGSSRLVLFSVKEESETKSAFFKAIGTSPDGIKKVWMKAKLTGSGEPPTFVTEEEIVSKVSQTSGGIGFVSSDKVTGSVKVLFTIK